MTGKRLTAKKLNTFVEELLNEHPDNETLIARMEAFYAQFPFKFKEPKKKVKRGIGSY